MIDVLILGASGMLGSMVTDYFSGIPDLKVAATLRSQRLKVGYETVYPNVKFNIFEVGNNSTQEIEALISQTKWVINCVGVIKPYIKDDSSDQVQLAICVNSLFPHLLAKAAQNTGATVIQIATDCVFSGKCGSSDESAPHDPLDAYGKSKSLGEVHASNFFNLRCSIIGPEPKAHVSLLDWFLSQPKDSVTNGYTNHLWNGVTTLAFAKICLGIVRQSPMLPAVQHVIPSSPMAKVDMLRCFALNYKRGDIAITPTESTVQIDRTLATQNSELNQQLWQAAGYCNIPSIPEMIAELAKWDCKQTGSMSNRLQS